MYRFWILALFLQVSSCRNIDYINENSSLCILRDFLSCRMYCFKGLLNGILVHGMWIFYAFSWFSIILCLLFWISPRRRDLGRYSRLTWIVTLLLITCHSAVCFGIQMISFVCSSTIATVIYMGLHYDAVVFCILCLPPIGFILYQFHFILNRLLRSGDIVPCHYIINIGISTVLWYTRWSLDEYTSEKARISYMTLRWCLVLFFISCNMAGITYHLSKPVLRLAKRYTVYLKKLLPKYVC
jgi:hypothetical protein